MPSLIMCTRNWDRGMNQRGTGLAALGIEFDAFEPVLGGEVTGCVGVQKPHPPKQRKAGREREQHHQTRPPEIKDGRMRCTLGFCHGAFIL